MKHIKMSDVIVTKGYTITYFRNVFVPSISVSLHDFSVTWKGPVLLAFPFDSCEAEMQKG